MRNGENWEGRGELRGTGRAEWDGEWLELNYEIPYPQAVLDVLVPLVRGCKVGGLPETFISDVFPCVVQRVLDSDDSSLLQVRR